MNKSEIRNLEQAYFDIRWEISPVAASDAGITKYDIRYGRYDEKTLAKPHQELKVIMQKLENMKVSNINDRIDRRALLNDVRVFINEMWHEKPQETSHEYWLSLAFNGLHSLVEGERKLEERSRSLIKRLQDLPSFLENAHQTLQHPIKLYAETAKQRYQGGLLLLQHIKEKMAPKVPRYEDGINVALETALEALKVFEADIEKGIREGSDDFASGKDTFDFLLHFQHMLPDDHEEIWTYGHEIWKVVENDLSQQAKKMGSSDWLELADKLRGNHPKPNELVKIYSDAMDRAKEFLDNHKIVTVPNIPVDVVPTPSFIVPVTPYAAYHGPGVYDSTKRGKFYVTIPRGSKEEVEQHLRDHCTYDIPSTAVHEGYPGHHLQRTHESNPDTLTRKMVGSQLTVEGWAFYCETLMREQGFFTSAEEEFFQAIHLLWRAARVILDTGIHTKGVTYEQAVKFLVDKLHIAEKSAEAEVRRYCTEPTDNISYMVGRREILKMRKDYQSAKGSNLKEFHDSLLSYGGIPLTLIRWGMGI